MYNLSIHKNTLFIRIWVILNNEFVNLFKTCVKQILVLCNKVIPQNYLLNEKHV